MIEDEGAVDGVPAGRYPRLRTLEEAMSEPAYPLASPETGRAWPVQGNWTYEDYLRLPDDGRRYEVIRGHLYVAPAPTFDHQYAVWQLSRLLGNFVVEKGLGILLPAPFDLRLPGGLASPVQPDLIFLRLGNQPRPGDRSFEGVPDLVIEVLSPATRNLDRREYVERELRKIGEAVSSAVLPELSLDVALLFPP